MSIPLFHPTAFAPAMPAGCASAAYARSMQAHGIVVGLPTDIAEVWGGAYDIHGYPLPEGRWAMWRSLIARRLGLARRERTSAELTTQIAVTRGQALRDAHRHLNRQMREYPALRSMAPHLYALEKGMRKHGSRALVRLPLPVLREALDQLALLTHGGPNPEESDDVRVLRVRLSEAIALRAPRGGYKVHQADSRLPFDMTEGVDVRDISVDEFNTAMSTSGADSRGHSGFLDSHHPLERGERLLDARPGRGPTRSDPQASLEARREASRRSAARGAERARREGLERLERRDAIRDPDQLPEVRDEWRPDATRSGGRRRA